MSLESSLAAVERAIRDHAPELASQVSPRLAAADARRNADLNRRLGNGELRPPTTRVLTLSGSDLVGARRRGSGPARPVSRTPWAGELPASAAHRERRARPRRHRVGLAPRRVCERSRRPAGRRVQRITRASADSDPPDPESPPVVAGGSFLIDLFRRCAHARGVSPQRYAELVLDAWEDDDLHTLEHFRAIAAKAAMV
jgi:hypothetical protein